MKKLLILCILFIAIGTKLLAQPYLSEHTLMNLTNIGYYHDVVVNCDMLELPTDIQDDQFHTLKAITWDNGERNPATSGNKLHMTQASGARYRICDVTGKMLQEGIVGASDIDVSNLATGIYILKVQEGANPVTSLKFIKQ